MRRFLVLLLALAPWSAAQELEVRLGTAGVWGRPPEGLAFPKSKAVYRQPVARATTILQGNGGAYSHNFPGARHSWDYALKPGDPVLAARAGVVRSVRVESQIGGPDRAFANASNQVLVDHGDGTTGVYLHLQPHSVRVRVGEHVVAGERIAAVGDTGWAGMPHLHFHVWNRQGLTEPIRFADFERNDGVPRKGDRVSASAPATPQARIDARKKALRASAAAERLGLPGLARAYLVGDVGAGDDWEAQVVRRRRARLGEVALRADARLLAGLRCECEGDLAGARRHYRKARELAGLRRVIAAEVAAVEAELKSLAAQAPRCLSWHKSRLLDRSKELMKRGRDAVRDWRKALRDEKDQARAAWERVRDAQRAVVKALR